MGIGVISFLILFCCIWYCLLYREIFILFFPVYNIIIDRESIIEVIKDYQEMDLPDLVERDIDIPLDLKIKRAISIIGPRRAGKTYTMFQLMKTLLSKGIVRNRILYINFEDYRLEGINYSDLEKIIEVYYEMYPENSRLKMCFFWMRFRM